MDRLIQGAIQVARRVGKGAAALALHYSGARELLSAVQRRAVGGRRILILSYHRVVADFAQEAKRSLQTLNIEQRTFRRHLEVLQESHDVVSLEDALCVLDGTRQAARDVAVITFDDGYRDVYRHAFPVMRDLRVPGPGRRAAHELGDAAGDGRARLRHRSAHCRTYGIDQPAPRRGAARDRAVQGGAGEGPEEAGQALRLLQRVL